MAVLYYSLARIGTIACNVPLLSTIVTGLVARRLGAIGRNVTHLATVETATVLRSRLVDDRSILSFEAGVCAVTGDVARFAAVVARFGATATAAATTEPTSSLGVSIYFNFHGCRVSVSACSFT